MKRRIQIFLIALTACFAASAARAQTETAPAEPAAAPPAPAATTPAQAQNLPPIVTVPAPKSGEVVSPVARERLLTLASKYLHRANPALEEELENAANPFFPPPPPPPVAPSIPGTTTQTPDAGPALPPPPPQLTDDERLAQAAAVLVPDGVFILGDRSILKFPGGKQWRSGEAISINFPGDSAPSLVILQSATQFDFTIRLNDATRKVPIQRPRTTGPDASSASQPPAPTPSTTSVP